MFSILENRINTLTGAIQVSLVFAIDFRLLFLNTKLIFKGKKHT